MEEQTRKYTLSDFLQEKDNLAEIDERFEALSAHIGRLLTKEETDDILDIVDEYTPKNENGNYLYPLIPFEYAWEIYEIKKSEEE